MDIARVFAHGGSQAVRLPKEYRFDTSEVYVRRVGADVVLSAKPPTNADAMLDALASFEPGTRIVREQPETQERVPIQPQRAARGKRLAR